MGGNADKTERSGLSIYLPIAALAVMVMGGLAWAAISFFSGTAELANQQETNQIIADLKTLEASLERYRSEFGGYPSTEQGLQALVARPTQPPIPENWQALTVRNSLDDPWGNLYGYRSPGQEGRADSFDLWTVGADGVRGTEDDVFLKDTGE